ncbi:hypothetical protein BB561_005014 [Smittium simulii]|uniref:anthranilate synthase n=1 Tax=Smittium simulii TaxID=133385 RepID=A0A2T9YCW3_9FUNG|nr:hypothetical protein BB561_005014 [Smittium simulii]
MRTLLIDNYDSYTNNFITLWCEALKTLYSEALTEAMPYLGKDKNELVKKIDFLFTLDFMREHLIIIRNNQYSWDYIQTKILPHIDNVIISPGPGSPDNRKDFGVCSDIIKHCNRPVLGICLGHQGIAYRFGAKIIKAKFPIHGQKSKLEILEQKSQFSNTDQNKDAFCKKTLLFQNIPQNVSVVRYHSLVVDIDDFPDELIVVAKSASPVEVLSNNGQRVSVLDEQIMALRHKHLPLYGVQFHPEKWRQSIGGNNYDSYTNNFITLWCEALKILYSEALTEAMPYLGKDKNELVKKIDFLFTLDFMREHLIIIRNNQYSWDYIQTKILPHIDNVIISPGPGSPDNRKDFGVCSDIIKHCNRPVLGICLGHQGIAYRFRAKIIKAKFPIHGQKSKLEILEQESQFSNTDQNKDAFCKKTLLFQNIPQNVSVVRYHSLVVDIDDFPDELIVVAKSASPVEVLSNNGQRVSVLDEQIMALRHKHLPLYGVQFHPESVGSEFGQNLLSNFFKITIEWNNMQKTKTEYLSESSKKNILIEFIESIFKTPSVSLSEYSLLFYNLIKNDKSFKELSPITIFEKKISVKQLFKNFISTKESDFSYDFSHSLLTSKIFKCLFSSDMAPFIFDCSKESSSYSNTSIMGSLINPKKIISKMLSSQNLNNIKDQNRNISFFDWAQTELIEPDFGVCSDIIKHCNRPVLGICLGHQGIAYRFRAKIIKAKFPIHGQKSKLEILEQKSQFSNTDQNKDAFCKKTLLFQNIPQNVSVVRYHSLVVDIDDFPDELIVVAKSASPVEVLSNNGQRVSVLDEQIMALRHKHLPLYGVQFHPESVGSEFGQNLLSNFFKITIEWNNMQKTKTEYLSESNKKNILIEFIENIFKTPSVSLSEYSLLFYNLIKNDKSFKELSPITIFEKKISVKQLFKNFISTKESDFSYDFSHSLLTSKIFECLFSSDMAPFIFDCSKESSSYSNTSIMGSLINPKKIISKMLSSQNLNNIKDQNRNISFFDWAQTELIEPVCQDTVYFDFDTDQVLSYNNTCDRPMFRAGWVGYIGYDMHSETKTVIQPFSDTASNKLENKINDSILTLSTQTVVIHQNIKDSDNLIKNSSDNDDSIFIYLYAIFQNGKNQKPNANSTFDSSDLNFSISNYEFNDKISSTDWIKSVTEAIIKTLDSYFEEIYNEVIRKDYHVSKKQSIIASERHLAKNSSREIKIIPRIPKELYLEKIRESQNLITIGESYELCLTNKFKIETEKLEGYAAQKKYLLKLYFKYLRVLNPTPMSAFFLYPKSPYLTINNSAASSNQTIDVNVYQVNVEKSAILELDLGILSCSPERFLKVEYNNSQKWVAQMKPIKGTVERIPHGSPVCAQCKSNLDVDLELKIDKKSSVFCKKCSCKDCCQMIDIINKDMSEGLKNDIKEQAENLMIVDLVRHDLAAVSLNNLVDRINPIALKVNALETFETVFQLVSTIEAQLYSDSNQIPNLMQVIGHVFPPGSMTGAPKIRSVELLKDKLENNATEGRGLYSGCIGYISAYQGQMDWSVVIRTLVAKGMGNSVTPELSIDAGGAITILSDPMSEWSEVLTKLNSILYG